MRTLRLLPMLFAFIGTFALAQAVDPAADLKKLEGTWVLVSGKRDGQALPAEHVSKSRIVWKGKDVVVETPHQAKDPIKAVVTPGAAGAVRTLDWTRANGPDAGKTMLAIYDFRGPDEYVVVFAPAGKDRPKALDSKPGSGTTMHVWKRQK
jgi:uncharacterized protein (TIGR03067 family)